MTIPELRLRVAEAMHMTPVDEDATRAGQVLNSSLNAWILAEVTSLVELVDANPRLGEAFAVLVDKKADTVGTDNHLSYPPNALRLRAGEIEGRGGRIVRHLSLPVDAFSRPSLARPWFVTEATYIDVRPHEFADKQSVLTFIRKPTDVDSFGDELADAIVYGAAVRGLLPAGETARMQTVQGLYIAALSKLGVNSGVRNG
jgi:hypothetical protein